MATIIVGCSAVPMIPEGISSLRVSVGAFPEELAEVSVGGASLVGLSTQHLLLSESVLTKVDLTESRLSHLRASDVAFDECNFSNAKVADTSFLRAAFGQSKLSGLQVNKSSFADVTFRECRLDFAVFVDATLKNVTFENCLLREADFSKSMLDHVSFVDCDLARASFSRMRVRRSEMRRCALTGMRGLADLRGVSMELDDLLAHAPLFAAELGIGIAERRA